MLDKQEKLSLVFVPFQGDSEVALALLGDHIRLSAPIYASIKSLADGKKVKLLAASSKKRLEFAPDIPTVNELGYNSPAPDPQSVYGPKGTPEAVVKLISDASRKVVENPDYRTKVFGLGVPIHYQDAATIEKANPQVKDEIYTFFKEEGLVK
jgi:tripartite-type tricarboxylate transporter receptor subunit TctC